LSLHDALPISVNCGGDSVSRPGLMIKTNGSSPKQRLKQLQNLKLKANPQPASVKKMTSWTRGFLRRYGPCQFLTAFEIPKTMISNTTIRPVTLSRHRKSCFSG